MLTAAFCRQQDAAQGAAQQPPPGGTPSLEAQAREHQVCTRPNPDPTPNPNPNPNLNPNPNPNPDPNPNPTPNQVYTSRVWAVDQLFALAKCSVQRHRKPLPQIGKEARHRAANPHPPPSPSPSPSSSPSLSP